MTIFNLITFSVPVAESEPVSKTGRPGYFHDRIHDGKCIVKALLKQDDGIANHWPTATVMRTQTLTGDYKELFLKAQIDCGAIGGQS